MSLDYTALAGSVGVGLPEVRACLLLSREGLAVGVYPATTGDEEET
jgi:hypothetical protein